MDEEQNGAAATGERTDIVVAGGAYVGLSLALAIKSAAPHLRIVVADIAPDGVWQRDGRASAIAASAVRMLSQLGVWQKVKDEAQPIMDMIVTDSRTSDPVRPVFLTFEGEARPGPRHRPHDLGIGGWERIAFGVGPDS